MPNESSAAIACSSKPIGRFPLPLSRIRHLWRKETIRQHGPFSPKPTIGTRPVAVQNSRRGSTVGLAVQRFSRPLDIARKEAVHTRLLGYLLDPAAFRTSATIGSFMVFSFNTSRDTCSPPWAGLPVKDWLRMIDHQIEMLQRDLADKGPARYRALPRHPSCRNGLESSIARLRTYLPQSARHCW